MFENMRNYRWLLAVMFLMMSITVPAVYADDDDDDDDHYRSNSSDSTISSTRVGEDADDRKRSGKSKRSQVSNASWKEECGACHMAYPARFLSAESWRVMMNGLEDHFGSDASLDVETATEISNFLQRNASRKKRKSSNGIEPALRISDTRWFQSEHDDVAARTWKSPKVKSPSNCAACHTKADNGSFRERDIKIPK